MMRRSITTENVGCGRYALLFMHMLLNEAHCDITGTMLFTLQAQMSFVRILTLKLILSHSQVCALLLY